jgi:hypothetical protein
MMRRVEQVADAVLYEGYLLYPYRPSAAKNRQRWTFGGVHPRCYSQAQGATEAWQMSTECLVLDRPETTLTVRVRFLHLLDRSVAELTPPLSSWPEGEEPAHIRVPILRVGDRTYPAWQEASERTILAGDHLRLIRLLDRPRPVPFTLDAERYLEPIRENGGEGNSVVGMLIREHAPIAGEVQVSARRLDPGLVRLGITIQNLTPLADPREISRQEALKHSLVSTHTILEVQEGEFVSLLDPPEAYQEHAARCENVGTWPVLAGEPGARDTLLSSPIILYDYPEVAPESPGDFFDATEIDEMLTLRILTMTDEEKQEMAATDERARQLLERTEALAREQLLGSQLHGVIRTLRPLGEGDDHVR